MRRKLLPGLAALAMLFALAAMPAGAEETATGGNVAKIGDVEYATLNDAVAAAQPGNTITLLDDASGCGIIIDSSKVSGLTIDFNNHTYTIDTDPLAGSPGTEYQCFQILTGGSVTMKSGAIVANHSSALVMIQNYCDLTLEDMTLDANEGSNNVDYVLSNNCGNTVIKNTTITPKTGCVAFDVYGGWYEDDVTVTVTSNSVINGLVELDRDTETDSKNILVVEDDATVKGDVSVTAGTSVTIEGAKVEGSVSVEYGSGAIVTVLDSEVTGTVTDNVTVLNSTVAGTETNQVADGIIALVGNGTYTNLADAVEAAKNGGTVKLLAAAILEKTQEITSDMTIDLNGNDIVGLNVRALHVKSGTLTLTTRAGDSSVTIDAIVSPDVEPISTDSSVIRVGDDGTGLGAAGLVIDPGVSIDAPRTYGVTVFGNNSALDLTVSGQVAATGQESAISGNGSEKYMNTPTNITIAAGAEVSTDGAAAIYHPQQGTLTIKDGAKVTAYDGAGIVARAGNIVIEGGIVSGDGEGTAIVGDCEAVPLPKSAVVYDSRADYPGLKTGTNKLTITGGNFWATDGVAAVTAVTPEGGESMITISGGIFTSAVPEEYCAEDFHPNVTPDGRYSVHVHASDDGVVTVEPTANTPGELTYTCTVCGAVLGTEAITGVLEILPTITDTSYTVGTDDGAVLHCSGALNDFESVSVDGALVDSSNYTLTEGSTILTFTKAYLDTLAVGQHSVVLTYKGNRTVPTTLTVVAAAAPAAPQTDHPEIAQAIKDGTWGKPDPTPAPAATPAPAPAPAWTVRVPQTGDAANPVLWAVVMTAALLGFAGAGAARRRRD